MNTPALTPSLLRRWRTLRRSLAALTALVSLVSGCGADDEDDPTEPEPIACPERHPLCETTFPVIGPTEIDRGVALGVIYETDSVPHGCEPACGLDLAEFIVVPTDGLERPYDHTDEETSANRAILSAVRDGTARWFYVDGIEERALDPGGYLVCASPWDRTEGGGLLCYHLYLPDREPRVVSLLLFTQFGPPALRVFDRQREQEPFLLAPDESCGWDDIRLAAWGSYCGDDPCADGWCWEDGDVTCRRNGGFGGECSAPGSDECGEGLVCSDGRDFPLVAHWGQAHCLPAPGTIGAWCDSDDDCPQDSACTTPHPFDAGSSAPAGCAPPPGSASAACETDDDCDDGRICAPFHELADVTWTRNLCVLPGILERGEGCVSTDALCADGLVCRTYDPDRDGSGPSVCNPPCP